MFHIFLLLVRMITYMLSGIHNRRSGLTYCNVTDSCCFYEITPSTQPTCITLCVVSLDEINISGCLHFSMQNIEMSCNLDRASRQRTSTSANNVLCLSAFAWRHSRTCIATTLCSRVSLSGCSNTSVTNEILHFIRITEGVGLKIIK